MDPSEYDRTLRVATVVCLVAGVAFIFLGDVVLTTAGVLLVILSALVFLVVVRNALAERDPSA